METLWLCTSLTSGWFFAPCWIRINLSSSVEVAGGDFSGCASPPSLSLNHNKSPDVMVRSQTHWLPASWDAAPTSLDLDQTACPLVCFLLSSSTTCHSHCILILWSVIKSTPPPLSLLDGFLSAEFLSSASTAAAAAAALTAPIAFSGLGIGRCMTTCSCSATNQKASRAAGALFGTKQRRACGA